MNLLMNFWNILLNFFLLFIFVNANSEANNNATKLAPKKRLKILVYSTTIGWSHMQFLGTVADTLMEAGHDVHFLRVHMNYRTKELPKEVHKIEKIRNFMPKLFESVPDQMDINKVGEISDNFGGNNFKRFLFQTTLYEDFMGIFTAVCQEIVNDANLLSSLEKEQFDVAIAESYTVCPFAIFRRIGAKTSIGANAVTLFQSHVRPFGIPTFSSYVTNVLTPVEGAPKLNFLGRLTNFYNELYDWLHISELQTKMEQPVIQQAFGNSFPQVKEIAGNVSLLFTNTNAFFELPRPLSNKIINIGGIVEMKAGRLENPVKQILDQSKAGTVLVSFGTFVDIDQMSRPMKLAFLRAFAHFSEYDFIWKIDLAGHPTDVELFSAFKNVHTFKWIDQKSVLLHPRLRAFITHCGQNSVSEAARAGVPMIGIPLLGDQLYNAIVAIHRKVALKLDARQLHEEGAEHLIVEALDKILHDPLYRENAQLVMRKLELSPFSAKEKLVRWVEFAAEFPELNELNLPWENELGTLAYYSIDVILFTLTVLCAAVYCLYNAVKLLMKLFIERREKIKEN